MVIWKKGRSIPEDTDGTRVKHERKRELHRVAQPTLGKGTKQVTMSNKNDVRGVLSVHVVLVGSPNFTDEVIDAIRDLLGGSIFTPLVH